MTEKEETNKLKGEVNYLGWHRLIVAELMEKGCLLPEKAPKMDTSKTGKELASDAALNLKMEAAKESPLYNGFRIDKEKELTAKYIVTKSIAILVLNNIPIDVESAIDLLLYCKTAFGSVDAYTRKQRLKKIKMHANNCDPRLYFEAFSDYHAQYVAAGGQIGYDEILEMLLEGLNQTFYKDLIRDVNKARRQCKPEAAQKLFAKTKEEIRMFFDDTPQGSISIADPLVAQLAMAMKEIHSLRKHANVAARDRPGFVKRHCTTCATEGRDNASKSHNTEDHVDNFRGRGKPLSGNKPGENYPFSLAELPFYDTGATDHFFKDKPSKNYRKIVGTVQTAAGQNEAIIGEGTVALGDLILENVQHCPTFSKNLISGSKLASTGHWATIDPTGFLTVTKGTKIVASGKTDPKTRLIQIHNKFSLLTEENGPTDVPLIENHTLPTKAEIDSIPSQVTRDINEYHLLAHAGPNMMRRTARAENVKLIGTLKFCPICTLTKSNQKAKRRSKTVKAYQPLESTHIDLTGPYPLLASDNSVYNVKFVDESSGWIHMQTLPNKSAAGVAKVLTEYKSQLELRTDFKMVNICTDQGTEFDGAVFRSTSHKWHA